MALPGEPVFTVIAVDYLGPTRRFQDLTAINIVDLQNTKIDRNAWMKSTGNSIILKFQQWTPNLRIHELMEIWIGVKVDGIWEEVWFGGYLVSMRGSRYGMEHIIECGLHTYDILLDRTAVWGYPVNPIRVPATGLEGYPENYSARDWFVGRTFEGKPFDGVLPMHLQYIDLGGIEPAFNNVIFTYRSRPVTTNILGYIGMCSLRQACEVLANVITNHNPEMRPTFFMKPVADGSMVRPQFCLIDQADRDAPADFVFSDNPQNETEYYLEEPFYHDRDASDLRTRLDVKGVGFDPLLVEDKLTFATYSQPEHMARYKTYYQVEPGWAGAPVMENRIETIEQATKLAEKLENNVWGARGSVTFMTDILINVGQRVRIIDTMEGLNTIYPVIEVTTNKLVGRPLYTVTVGFKQLGIQDVMGGSTIDLIRMGSDLSYLNTPQYQYNDPWSGTTGAEAQTAAPLTGTPAVSAQNGVQSMSDNATAWNFYAAANLSGVTPDGVKINTNSLLPKSLNPKPNVVWWRPDLEMGDWFDPDNLNHPHHYPWRFEAASTQDQLVPAPCNITVMMVRGPGTVTLTREGIAFDPPEHIATLANATLIYFWKTPCYFDYGDLMGLTVTGGAGVTRVTLSELLPMKEKIAA